MSKKVTRREFLQGSGAVAVASLLGTSALGERLRRQDTKIVRAAIFPAIGVARIGNSDDPNGFFIGPEIVDPPLTPYGFSRDAKGAIKRQAARFRIYGYNEAGEVVRELTAKNADIKWTVELANRKSQWYRFVAALDIDETNGMRNIRRNAEGFKGKDREKLAITPPAKSISGRNTRGAEYHMGGTFVNVPVELGELRTDKSGRLLVLGGKGKAGYPPGPARPIFTGGDTFNNADWWYDDTSDGSVDATVKIDGDTIPVEGSWVIVAPPNFAPDIIGFRTMYDLLCHLYMSKGLMEKPETSFKHDVLPLLQRLANLSWVNQGFAKVYGTQRPVAAAAAAENKKLPDQKPYDFEDPKLIKRLNDKAEVDLRKEVYNRFRCKDSRARGKDLWPMMYGDSYGTVQDSVNEDFYCPDLFEIHLKNWRDGKYTAEPANWNPKRTRKVRKLASIPKDPLDQQPEELKMDLALQPDMLTRAALHFCLADAFHPGCELTWPMRHISLYEKPFRIKRRDPKKPEADYGDELTIAIAESDGGPLQGQVPGGLTRWMAMPWHGDTAFCRAGYEPEIDPYLPTFWPARVPNHVLSKDAYDTLRIPESPQDDKPEPSDDEKWAAFNHRENWFRNLTGGAVNQMEEMVKDFQRMGVIEAAELPEDGPFPSVVFVENLPPHLAVAAAEAVPKSFATRSIEHENDPVRKAGWENKEVLEEFRSIRVTQTWKKKKKE